MARIPAIIAASIISFTGFSSGLAYAQSNKVACFVPYTAPAVIETVTEQILVQTENRGIDPQTGQSVVISPAIYRTEIVQKIITERQEAKIEIVCPQDQSFDFIQTLQRALTVRGHYFGGITGQLDQRTKRAVRKVQKSYGVNIADVTVELAQSYGLIVHKLFSH